MQIKPLKGIHSEMHLLAKDISEYCREPKKFAMYLGVIKRIGLHHAYKIFSEIKQQELKAKHPGKLFMFKSKEYYKTKKRKKHETAH